MEEVMLLAKFLVVFILLFIFQDGAESWRRRRRRQCTPQDCQVSCWDSWRSYSASTCGREGSQSRSRSVTSYASCGGGSCPELHESRQCYGSPTENCQLSSWSQWTACPAIRGNSSAKQSSTRHRITPEKCEEWCTSTLRKTRMCLREPVNCTGHSGEKEKRHRGNIKSGIRQSTKISIGCSIGGVGLCFAIAVSCYCYWRDSGRVYPS